MSVKRPPTEEQVMLHLHLARSHLEEAAKSKGCGVCRAEIDKAAAYVSGMIALQRLTQSEADQARAGLVKLEESLKQAQAFGFLAAIVDNPIARRILRFIATFLN